jgi:GMP synthase-like glutamine amidotransferase
MSKERIISLGLVAAVFLTCFAATLVAQIAGVTVTVSPKNYNGPCPARIRFTGVIQVEKSPMLLNCYWTRSDGVKKPVKQIKVARGTTSVTITDTWTLSPHGRQQISETLRVRSGMADVSSSATATVNCR